MNTQMRSGSELTVFPGLSMEAVAKDAVKMLGKSPFEEIEGWEGLSDDERGLVETEGQYLARAILTQGYSTLAIGAHLAGMQEVLEPHGLFGAFLRPFDMPVRSAYRAIARYKNASGALPNKTVLKVAMLKGMDIAGEDVERPLGKYTEAAARATKPKDESVASAEKWLDTVERTYKERGGGNGGPALVVNVDKERLLKESYRYVGQRMRRIGARGRSAWLETVVGLLLADLGVSEKVFRAQGVPEGWKAKRGRPRKGTGSSAAA